MITPPCIGVLALLFVLVSPALAAEPEIANTPDSDSKKTEKSVDYVGYPEHASVTHHSVTVGGEIVHYDATAGTITLVDSEREPTAKMFYIAYRRTNGPDAEFQKSLTAWDEEHKDEPDADGRPRNYPDANARPLTFSFNGGPGSSSVWLHLGVFGPRCVSPADEVGNPGPPPYKVMPNDLSLLDQSDFVFIDPVSTGYSRAEKPDGAKDFHGVETDAASVAEFIRRYITREKRWTSPKFIAGESYGTTRAAALTRELHEEHGISLNGVILVSSVLNFQTIRFDVGNDLPFIVYLPTYAAAAYHHKKIAPALQSRTLDEVYEESRRFAMGEYAAALMQGDKLAPAEEERIAGRLSEFTGLDAGFIRRARLRISIGRFAKELLRDQRRTIGRFDARFTGIDRDEAGEGYEYDPSYAAIRSIYTESFNAYIREELGYESDLPYEILTSVGPWEFGPGGDNRYLNVAERMRSVMHQQPGMKVFVAGGYHDMATPLAAAEYVVDHLGLAPEYRANVTLRRYIGGHMMYMDRASFEKLREDLVAFYRAAIRH